MASLIFEDLLKAAPAEDQAVLNKYFKVFAEGVQSDLDIISRSEAALRDELARTQAKLAEQQENVFNWQRQYWDPTPRPGFPNGRTKAEVSLQTELDAANAKLAEGESPSPASALDRLADTIESGISVRLSVDTFEDFAVTLRHAVRQPNDDELRIRLQRARIIWVGAAMIILAALFPPWIQGPSSGIHLSLSYAPLWAAPGPTAQIDVERLLIEWGSVGILAGSILITLREVLLGVEKVRKRGPTAGS